jgi:O-succinylbenzoic acid--CoA ligase
VLLGGASVPSELIQQAREINLPVHPTYGLTETASQVATATPAECFEDPTTVGYPLFETEVTICDEDGTPLEAGEEGVIHVDGPTVMEGYFQKPLLNDRAFTHHGFRTDDRGYMDQQGRLHVVSGSSDKIVTGGEKVAPGEVTDVLLNHDRLADAAVFGIDDTEWGEKVVAIVVPADHDVDEDDLLSSVRARLDERLAPFKHPKEIVISEDVPRTSKGTLRHQEAEERIRAEQDEESTSLDLGEGT